MMNYTCVGSDGRWLREAIRRPVQDRWPESMAVVGDGDAQPTSVIRVPGRGHCGFDTASLRSEQPGSTTLHLCALMGGLCWPMTYLRMSFPVAIASGRSCLSLSGN